MTTAEMGMDSQTHSAEDGWKEVDNWMATADEDNWMYDEGRHIADYLERNPRYDLVQVGIGGTPHYREFVEENDANAKFQALWKISTCRVL